MSRQRKHVADDVLSASPLPTESLRVARVVESRGSNILEVEFESGESILATFPARYTKKIWIKRGDFVMVEQADLRASGKVVGVITSVIRDDQIRHIKDHGLWYVHGTDAALCVCVLARVLTAATLAGLLHSRRAIARPIPPPASTTS